MNNINAPHVSAKKSNITLMFQNKTSSAGNLPPDIMQTLKEVSAK